MMALTWRMRRRIVGRRSMALVVALAFVVGFLGLAALVVQMTSADHLDSIALTNNTQVELSSAAAMEDGAAQVNARTALTPAALNAWAATRSGADPQTATLGRSCYSWWLESFDADAGAARLISQTWSPGHLTAEGCATPPRARVPVGVDISATLERGEDGRWHITERVVAPVSIADDE